MSEHKAQCHGCGLAPNIRSGDVVIWCDECYSDLRDRLARMHQPVVDAAIIMDSVWSEYDTLCVAVKKYKDATDKECE